MSTSPTVYFMVILEQGDNWNIDVSMREQEQWDEHASYMDALVEEGFIILGGPLNNEEKALLIINADNKEVVETRFSHDPWIRTGIRHIASIERWEILLDSRK